MCSIGAHSISAVNLSEIFHSKILFREKMAVIAPEYNPKFSICNDGLNAFDYRYPIYFKPEQAGGGRGIRLLNSPEDLKQLQSIGVKGRCLVEEKFDGRLYSVSLWIKDGKLGTYFGAREIVDEDLHRVKASFSSNGILNELYSAQIPQLLTEVYANFGFSTGFIHTQLIINPEGNWKIVEAMLRLPGDLYSYPIDNFGNLNYAQRYLLSFNSVDSVYGELAPKFYDNALYGRVMRKESEIFSSLFQPYFSVKSHCKPTPEAYQICFTKSKTSHDHENVYDFFGV
jgi:hypothetical protein